MIIIMQINSILYYTKSKTDKYNRAENDSVICKHLEIVLFNVIHKETYTNHGNRECADHSDEQYNRFSSSEAEAEFHEL